MVFDKRFDRALWIMLSSDKENRDYIARMIACIPQEAYGVVRCMIDNYYNGTDTRSFCDCVLDEMYFSAAIVDNELFVELFFWNDKEEESFELCLANLTSEDLLGMTQFKNQFLGSFEYLGGEKSNSNSLELNNIWSIERYYELRRTPLGYRIGFLNSRNDNIYDFRRARVKMVPDKMYPHQFDNGKKFQRLMRGRKK